MMNWQYDEKERAELDRRLRDIHTELVAARDAAQRGLKLHGELRAWMTQREIEQLQKLEKVN